MDSRNTSRRNFLSFALGVPLTGAALAACGSSGPSTAGSTGGSGDSGDSAGGATYWYLTGQPQEGIRGATVDRWNAAHADQQIATTTFQNDAFKQKIKTAIGAGEGPTIIWGWGGGGLRSYVDAGQVEDLTSWFGEQTELKDKIFPGAFGAATVDDKIYALPCETVTPIVLYYNKQVFERVGADLPESWEDIKALVPVFNDAGVAPFSLGGQSRWTNMMWLEFLFDRIGGPDVFNAILEGEADAWSNPDAIRALTEMQDFIKADGFIKGFSSITADSNADQALLYTGRAAMMVHGAWTYGSMKNDGGDFVTGGNLGWMNFPGVEGGKGDVKNAVGNPAQYMSISSKATAAEKDVAKAFFAEEVFSDASVTAWIESGNVPVVVGSDSQITGDDAEWTQFVYDLSSQAPVFVQSWDQAMSPTAAEALLSNIANFFQLSITPEQFATNMNGVIGQ